MNHHKQKKRRLAAPSYPVQSLTGFDPDQIFEYAEITKAVYERIFSHKPLPYKGSMTRNQKNERLAHIYLDTFRYEHTPKDLKERRRLCQALRPDIYTIEYLDKLTCAELVKQQLNVTNSTCIDSSDFEIIFHDSSKFFENPKLSWRNAIDTKTIVRVVIGDQKFLYLPQDYERERIIIRSLSQLNHTTHDPIQPVPCSVNTEQSRAISHALRLGVSIITGYAGTGKTYVIAQIVKSILRSKYPHDILLCAPTGAAAKRMKDTLRTYGVINDEENERRIRIGTIHSSIEYDEMMHPEGLNPDIGFVIVDEMSMVDLKTFSFLFLRPHEHRRFLFVGDPGQLPSVGRGRVFQDLINSRRFCETNLSEVVRQSDDSPIVDLASQIRSGISLSSLVQRTHPYPASPDEDGVSLFLESRFPDVRALLERAAQLFHEEVRKTGDQFKVHIMCPRSKHPTSQSGLQVCCNDFNPLFSDINAVTEPFRYPPFDLPTDLTEQSLEEHRARVRRFRDTHSDPYVTAKFRKGERLVCTKNLKDLKLVNGDMGLLELAEYDVDQKKWEYIVNFSGRNVKMDDEHLEMAYVTTVHKAQGNEYDTVIFLSASNDDWIKRELFYTAVTRAKKRLIILTLDERVLRECVRHIETDIRLTKLSELLLN